MFVWNNLEVDHTLPCIQPNKLKLCTILKFAMVIQNIFPRLYEFISEIPLEHFCGKVKQNSQYRPRQKKYFNFAFHSYR